MMTFDSAPQGDRKNIKVAKHSVPFSFNFFSTTTTKESLAIILIKKDCRQATHCHTFCHPSCFSNDIIISVMYMSLGHI